MSDGRRDTVAITTESQMSNVKGEMETTSDLSRRVPFTFHLSLLTCLLVALATCNESFQPLTENDTAPFSIYGYLDVSADTQWVRVTPIREQLDQPPVNPDMHVVLEHLHSSSAVTMKDSLFQSADGFNFINVWAVMNVEPGQSYRLEAERPDGATSQVTVTTPDDFPTPVLNDFGDGCRGTLRINGVDRLADVQSKWHVRILFFNEGKIIEEEDKFFSIPYRSEAERVGTGSYRVFINTYAEEDQIRKSLFTPPNVTALILVLERQIFVASGGPEWIEEIASLDDIIYALPEGLSNVENGVGYMVGIVSKTIPYESCF